MRVNGREPASSLLKNLRTTSLMITKPAAFILSGVLAVSSAPALDFSSSPTFVPASPLLEEKPLDELQFSQLELAPSTGIAPDVAKPERKPDIHYVPTPEPVVAEMLNMAKVGKGDTVYDLGCGDGRIVITAASKHGAKGIGIDIDPQRIAEANANAKKAGVEDRVTFMVKDLFKSDFKDATVISLYLLSSLNVKLRPKILAETKPGTRVVSHAFSMGDWEPDEQKTVTSNDVYYWVVPADLSGRWKLTGKSGDEGWQSVAFEQKYQKFSGTAEHKDGPRKITEGTIKGVDFTLTLEGENGGDPIKVRGKIAGDKLEARAEGSENVWTAERTKAVAGTK